MNTTQSKHTGQQSGQILLVIVMLVATVITIVMATTFRSRTDTQITKLEEESQKALAAAEAGLESALREQQLTGSFESVALDSSKLNLTNLEAGGVDMSRSSAKCELTQETTYVSQVLGKDGQYSFYLAPYVSGVFGATYSSGSIRISFGQSGNCPALEVSILRPAGTVIRRFAMPACASSFLSAGSGVTTVTDGTTVGDIAFDHQVDIPEADLSGGALMVVRVLSGSSSFATKLGFQKTDGSVLPAQRVRCESQAVTKAGVSRTVVSYQTLPQIPAELFITRF